MDEEEQGLRQEEHRVALPRTAYEVHGELLALDENEMFLIMCTGIGEL
jgi:hypothetical protein